MGFRLNRTYRLEFEGEMAGAEVRMRGASIAHLLEMKNATSDRELAELLVPLLIDWNMEDPGGETLPLTLDGVLGLEPEVMGGLVNAWYKAVLSVPAPLDGGSTSSGPFPEESIPMTPMGDPSPNPTN